VENLQIKKFYNVLKVDDLEAGKSEENRQLLKCLVFAYSLRQQRIKVPSALAEVVAKALAERRETEVFYIIYIITT
jgi:hypothetical protein